MCILWDCFFGCVTTDPVDLTWEMRNGFKEHPFPPHRDDLEQEAIPACIMSCAFLAEEKNSFWMSLCNNSGGVFIRS